jgi:hypothetical protein
MMNHSSGRPSLISAAFLGRREITIDNVVAHRSVEQEGLLLDESDLISHVGQGQIAQVDPIDQDNPTVNRMIA